MGLFEFFMGAADINAGVEEFKRTQDAVLLDVRTAEEYRGGHVPQSVNIPLQNLQMVTSKVRNKQTPLYIYCHSGSRSSQACAGLKRLGYTNVHNIGGIMNYRGAVE
ncbi:MAG: rhodanese-like domain-containing protein [Lachnospiraceae bacterium]|nr:rhodanese-like domain-containing protein [Lachnospiraceae bacterium]MDY5741415.1 rhodanese-like domain-containing protein [Lachnospiraceae bacterium]